MRRHNLISNANYTADLSPWARNEENYNFKEISLRTLSGVVKHSPGLVLQIVDMQWLLRPEGHMSSGKKLKSITFCVLYFISFKP